jgi:hypothetical protein
MKKLFTIVKATMLGLFVMGTSAIAAPITVDTTEIETSIANIGGSAITLVLIIAGFYIGYRLIKGLVR